MKNSSFSGKRLREEREKLGYTQAQAAEKCGVSGRMWGDYERGVSQPKSEQLFRFEQAGIDIDYVMHGTRKVELGAAISDIPKPGDALGELLGRSPALEREEQELLALFRQASDLGRAVILSAARGAEKKAAKDNQVSATHKTA